MGQFANDWDVCCTFNIAAMGDCDVELVSEPYDEAWNSKSYEQGHEQDDVALWGYGGVAAHGLFHHADVGLVDGELQRHLLALVEQICV